MEGNEGKVGNIRINGTGVFCAWNLLAGWGRGFIRLATDLTTLLRVTRGAVRIPWVANIKIKITRCTSIRITQGWFRANYLRLWYAREKKFLVNFACVEGRLFLPFFFHIFNAAIFLMGLNSIRATRSRYSKRWYGAAWTRASSFCLFQFDNEACQTVCSFEMDEFVRFVGFFETFLVFFKEAWK